MMLTADYDGDAGIVRSISRGFLTVEEVRRYHRDLAAAAAQARRQCGRLRLFIDATEGVVQSAEVMNAFLQQESATGPGDRMAVVVASGLAKMQTSRNFRSDREQAFLSTDAAMAWLMAE